MMACNRHAIFDHTTRSLKLETGTEAQFHENKWIQFRRIRLQNHLIEATSRMIRQGSS
jgi:hypothetical protein